MMLGNKEVMAKNISKYMRINNVDRTKLSKDLGIKYTTLSDWINAKTYPRIDKIEMLADYFKINKSDLVESEFDQIETEKIPVVAQISAGLPVYSEQDIIDYAYAPAYLKKNGRELFYLKVTGDSMDKEFKEGDLILVDMNSTVENGQIGVVQINGYNATVKRVKYNEDKIILLPESNNSDHLPQVYTKDDKVKIIGRVISAQKQY